MVLKIQNGPMTKDELKELACLGFTSDLVMQSFCHTAAYPKPVDIETQHTLPEFIKKAWWSCFSTRRRDHSFLVK
ncbi:MAG: hypothetical protein Ct9H90mP22_3090 [Gammaproteobacteria bacterium]|nr:MAG: hypothetical protein Ct9H90mP22_3090 [Gammaproteobacteria bacterium]